MIMIYKRNRTKLVCRQPWKVTSDTNKDDANRAHQKAFFHVEGYIPAKDYEA